VSQVQWYNDSIYLFFTAAGTFNTQAVQCIGLMKSADGTNFTSPQIAVQLPQDVYPLADNYWGFQRHQLWPLTILFIYLQMWRAPSMANGHK
jgi:hypothetical protein